MANRVTCGNCSERATIMQPSDAWQCPACGHTNRAKGPVEANPPSRQGEIDELKARLAELEDEERKLESAEEDPK
jgi:ribosomal protein L37AE/L43A